MPQTTSIRVPYERRPAGRQLAVAVTLVLAGAAGLRAQVPRAATAALPAVTTTVAPVATPYSWLGREEEIESFLKTAPIERWKDIPVGITKPRRAFFGPGGAAGSMAWKPLPTGVLHGKQESYRSEIAAYLLSRHLGLDLVPPVVERQIDGVKGAAVYWIDGVKPWDPSDLPKAAGAKWSRQTSRMFMFDQLIANGDRNQGNLLYDAAGYLYLIDHSRAFVEQRHLTGFKPPQQFDRVLWERMAALTRAELDALLRPWLTGPQISALLDRRDEMARHIDRQVRARGEQVVFLPVPSNAPSQVPSGASS